MELLHAMLGEIKWQVQRGRQALIRERLAKMIDFNYKASLCAN